MSTGGENLATGVNNAVSSVLTNYNNDSEAILNDLMSNANDLDIDSDTAEVLQYNFENSGNFWEKVVWPDSTPFITSTIVESGIGAGGAWLTSQKNYSLLIKNTVQGATSISTVTLEQAFTTQVNGQSTKAYIEIASKRIILSGTVPSSTTHIDFGKYLAGAGRLATYGAVVYPLKDTVVAMLAAPSSGDYLAPIKEATILAASGVAIGMVGVAIGPAAAITTFGGITLAFTGMAASYAMKTVLDNLPLIIDNAKALGRTAEEVMDDLATMVKEEITDFWEATQNTAHDILEQAGELYENFMDALIEIGHTKVQDFPDFLDAVKALFEFAFTQPSPLVLDLDGDGVETTNLAGSDAVYFDHGQDGYAEATGWVDSDDGLLAIDLNSDGIINNGAELFGDQTSERNGFEVLADYDSNQDGKISAEDAVWSDLRVWQDINNDGYSQSAELKTLDDLLITEIDLAYSNVNTTDNGNTVKQTGSFTMNGNSRTVSDVYFAVDKTNSIHNELFQPDIRTSFLANLKGYGTLPPLHIAMSLDKTGIGNLFQLVEDFNAHNFSDLFDADTDELSEVRDILFRWAGVDDINPTSRGLYVNAQELAFLEKLTGEPYLQAGMYSNPGGFAGESLGQAFDMALNGFAARLAIQGEGKDLFTGNVVYNPSTDNVEGITGLDLTKLAALETEATGLANTGLRETFWKNVVRVIEYTIGTDYLNSTHKTALEDAINDSDAGLNLTDIIAGLLDVPLTYYAAGSSGNDTMNGFSGNDYFSAVGGNDTLNGYGGNDELTGGVGDDTLNGGTGSDLLQGGANDDTYVYNAGDGFDVVIEQTGNDKILFGAGIDVNDLTFTRTGRYDLVISIDNAVNDGEIILQDQFYSNNTVETIQFNDTTTLSFSALSHTMTGTAGNDTLYGVEVGGGTADILYGGAGHDNVYSEDGNDTVYGEDGEDYIEGGSGADTLYGGNDDDEILGESDNDHLHGETGNDLLKGGYGDDSYYFTAGHDVMDDTAGTADTIYLASGFTSTNTKYFRLDMDMKIILDANNTILIKDHFDSNHRIETLNYDGGPSVNLATVSYTNQGDSGNNSLTGTSAADEMYGLGGNDTIQGYGGNDHLDGGDGNDNISGGDGNDILIGGLGADEMSGGIGNDRFEGGAGDDTTTETSGDDTYIYTSGHDEYIEYSGTDTIEMIEGWEESDLTFKRVGSDLIVEINAANSLLLEGQFSSSHYVFETMVFADSTTLNLATRQYETYGTSTGNNIQGIVAGGSINDIIYALAGDDTVYGNEGDDVIDGGEGNDTLNGGNGADTLVGGVGDDEANGNAGNDTYQYTSGLDTYEDTAGTETVKLDAEWALGDLTFKRVGADLVIEMNSSDKITLESHFTSAYAFEELKFADNSTINLTTRQYETYGTSGGQSIYGIVYNGSVNDIIYALGGNDTVYGNEGDDVIDGGEGNDTLNGGNGADTLVGGVGDDEANGNAGNDTYQYTSGLDAYEDTAGTETVKLDAEWALGDLTFKRVGADLVIEMNSSDKITLDSHFYTSSYAFEELKFADNSTINLTTRQYETHGTLNGENIQGIVYNGSINDIIFAAGGNDTVYGNDGNDVLYGGDGADTLYGGNNNDTLYGEVGNDTLQGNAGDDVYVYSSGMDTFYEYNSGGTDTIRMTGATTINDIAVTQSGSHANVVINSGTNEIYLSYLHYTSNYNIEGIEFADGFKTALMDYASWTQGTSSADTLTGSSGHNTIIGKAGNDTLDGAGGDDDIHGGTGNDTLYGGSGTDLVHGGEGDDILYGQDGLDTLYGGTGADIFVFQSASAFNNIDVIKDFTAGDGDKLNIADLLSGYSSGVSDINDFLSVTASSGNSSVFVDRDGTGSTYSATQIASLSNVTGLNVDDLYNNGQLIVV